MKSYIIVRNDVKEKMVSIPSDKPLPHVGEIICLNKERYAVMAITYNYDEDTITFLVKLFGT